jgi:hypothetical protein
MDNFSKNFKNGGRSLKPGKRPKPDKRWTILFIGNHGRTITLKRFKGMVLLTCLVLCISIAITVGLLYLSLNTRHEKNRLESDLQDLKAQIKALRYEKDVLMTKLVLAESRSKASPAEKPQKQSESVILQHNSSDYEETKQSTQLAKIKEKTAAEKVTEPPPADNPLDSGISVAIENFKLSPAADENLLSVQFKIKNTSPNSQRVAGHAIVVLKGEQLQQDQWLTIPRMSLSDGKPTGRQRGYVFGISYFKTMRFKTNLPKSPEIYQIATVFIFTGKGDLLLEQDFPVKLPSVPPAAASKPPSASSPSRSFAGPPSTTPSKPPSSSTATQPSTPTVTPPPTDELMNTLKN